jgi:hypothetical protein
MSRFLTRFGRNRFSPTPCFAYDAESAFSSLPRNVHSISRRCLPPQRLSPHSLHATPPSRATASRAPSPTYALRFSACIAQEEVDGLELDGHGEEAREPVHRDTWVDRLDGGSDASVERKRRARQRELRGSTAGAKLWW